MRRRLLFIAVGGLVALAILAIGLWTAPRWLVTRVAARSRRCLYSVPTRERVVALTIDDGPETTDVMLDTIEHEGHRCALGSIYPYDAQQSSARLSAPYVLSNVRPGAVIILHDGGSRGRRTVEVLRRVLPVLRARGYRVVSLTELAALRE